MIQYFSSRAGRNLLSFFLVLGAVNFSASTQSQTVQYLLTENGGAQGNPLLTPSELEIDQFGNTYVTDYFNNTVHKITPQGNLSTAFDGLSSVLPGGSGYGDVLGLDVFGSLFVTAKFEYSPGLFKSGVVKISSSGEQELIINYDGDGKNALGNAVVIAPDESGNVYVGGYSLYDHTVFKVFPNGRIRLLVNWAGDGKGNILDIVSAIESDSSGNVYVAGCRSNTVFRVNPDYSVELLIDQTGDGQGNELLCPSDIHLDSSGNIFVAGYNSHNAFRIEPDGNIVELIDVTTDGTGEGHITGGGAFWYANRTALLRPDSISTDTNGYVYIAGRFSGNIFRISPAGDVKMLLAVDRQEYSEGEFGSRPIATLQNTKFDKHGNAYSLVPEYGEVFKLVIDGSQVERAVETQGGISIPRLLVDGKHYRVMLTPSEGNASEYLVSSADEVAYSVGAATGNFSAGNISIPRLYRDGVSAAAELTLVKFIPLTFRLVVD